MDQTAPAWPISARTRGGAGNCQGVEMLRPLVSAQKGAQNMTNYQKTPRYGAEQEHVRRNHGGGGQDNRN